MIRAGSSNKNILQYVIYVYLQTQISLCGLHSLYKDDQGLSILVWISKQFERKIVNIFLTMSFNICFGCSKEPSHRASSK